MTLMSTHPMPKGGTSLKAGFSQYLYKKDTSNKIRVLHIYTFGAELIQESGIHGGKLVRNSKICKIKNEGKSNEVVPAEQAILEAKSKVAEKLTTGYFTSLEELESGKTEVVMPMLASDFKKQKNIDWNSKIFVQPKLDGMRALCFIKSDKIFFMSRAGKVVMYMDHILKQLDFIKEDVVLDGELYSDKLESFQDNMKAMKKYTPGITELISYHVYDIVCKNKYSERLDLIKKLFPSNLKNIEVVPSFSISSEKDLRDYHKKFLSEGYEGSIIRLNSLKGYESGARSSSLLKYKDFQDIALEVIDIIPSDARPKQGVVVCKLPNGHLVKASLKFSHEEREEWLLNRQNYIGKIANITYFEATDEGSLRFPVCIGIYEDR